MRHSQLRVYTGPDATTVAKSGEHDAFSRPSVPVSVGELSRILASAVQRQSAWLDDFSNEEVLISADLYEIVLAVEHYHRPSA